VVKSFSSLYIGILAATETGLDSGACIFVSVPFTSGSSLQRCATYRQQRTYAFQFPLHRDPRCNYISVEEFKELSRVSVPFTSGSSLQRKIQRFPSQKTLQFQFPLHRDPRCNRQAFGAQGERRQVFQFPLHRDPRCNLQQSLHYDLQAEVSVPFTSGSSLQPARPASGSGRVA